MLMRHLSYFVTLAKEHHFARAADVCHVAQPTLSAAIRKLEEDLGATLVVRGHRFVGLTPEGAKLLAWAARSSPIITACATISPARGRAWSAICGSA